MSVIVSFLTDYDFVSQHLMSRESIMLDVVVCVANNVITFNGKSKYINHKVCSYWFSDSLKRKTQTCCAKDKNYYSCEGFRHACGWPLRGHVLPLCSKQCSLDMRKFQIEFRVQLPLHIITECFTWRRSATKCGAIFCRSVYGLFHHIICF